MARVNLETFAGGALQEKFDDAMEKVLRKLNGRILPEGAEHVERSERPFGYQIKIIEGQEK